MLLCDAGRLLFGGENCPSQRREMHGTIKASIVELDVSCRCSQPTYLRSIDALSGLPKALFRSLMTVCVVTAARKRLVLFV